MLVLLVASLLLQQAPGTPPAAPPPAPGPRATPGARAAPPPAPIPPPPPAADALRGEWPREPSGRRISLEDTTSIDDALEAIAEAAGWNVVLNTGREGNKLLVLRLRDVPVENALRAALQGTDLVATRHAETVVVAPSFEAAAPKAVLSGFDKPTGKRFTGEFQDAPAGEALRKIAKAGGLSIVLPPEAKGSVNASFQNVPVEDALRAVLEQAGLAAERQGTLLVVSERARSFDLGARLRGKIPPDIGRQVDEAMRQADREMRQADREMRRSEREMGHVGGDRDRVVNGDVVIRPGERARDVVAVRGSVKLESGAEARDVVAVLGRVTLAGGARARNVTAVLGGIDVGPGAEIEGNATSVGGKIQVDPSADVGGEQTGVDVPGVSGVAGILGPTLLWGHAESGWFAVAQVLARFATYFALGLLLVALFPRRVDVVAASMVASPWKAIFTGLLGTFGLPVLTILLIVTVVGILLVPVQILAVFAAAALGFTALSFHIGRSLPVKIQRGTWVLQLAIGTAIVVLVTQIPLLGILALVAGWLLVFGAVLRSRFGGQTPVLPTSEVVRPPAPPAAPA